MEVLLKGRGVRITDAVRRRTEHKFAKLERLDPRLQSVEVELIEERNRRIDGRHRVEVACRGARRSYRAEAAAHDLEAALDEVLDRLERQIATDRGKRRNRVTRGGQRATIRSD